MSSDVEARPDEPGACGASGGNPTCYRDALRCFAGHVMREPGPVGMALALHAASEQVSQNLEQVGAILRRLDLDREGILALRHETRAILAELAA
jgi:hypothetical protein